MTDARQNRPRMGTVLAVLTMLIAAGCGGAATRATAPRAYGPTPRAAAEHRRDALLAGIESASPQLQPAAAGPCTRLHRRPWAAYSCPYTAKTTAGQCRSAFVIAVKWQPGLRLFAATAKRLGNCR